jgi:hypothetical protein
MGKLSNAGCKFVTTTAPYPRGSARPTSSGTAGMMSPPPCVCFASVRDGQADGAVSIGKLAAVTSRLLTPSKPPVRSAPGTWGELASGTHGTDASPRPPSWERRVRRAGRHTARFGRGHRRRRNASTAGRCAGPPMPRTRRRSAVRRPWVGSRRWGAPLVRVGLFVGAPMGLGYAARSPAGFGAMGRNAGTGRRVAPAHRCHGTRRRGGGPPPAFGWGQCGGARRGYGWGFASAHRCHGTRRRGGGPPPAFGWGQGDGAHHEYGWGFAAAHRCHGTRGAVAVHGLWFGWGRCGEAHREYGWGDAPAVGMFQVSARPWR